MTPGNPNLPLTAARHLAKALAACAPNQREAMLNQLMEQAAMALVVINGSPRAAAAVYRLADHLVTTDRKVA